MSVSIPIELPLDGDGFLRRECPHCEKEFKWRPTPPDQPQEQSSPTEASGDLPSYFCPLCGQSAKADAWWTQAQIEYASEIAKAQVLAPMIGDFQNSLLNLNRSGSSVRVSVTPVDMPMPAPLDQELNDMRRVDSPCHPQEPLKVPSEWPGTVFCLVCGVAIEEDASS